MSTIGDAWQAGIDAVIADNTINRGAFADAIRTVITVRFSNSDATDWIDAVAAELERTNVINNPTYNNMRGHIIDDPVKHRELFEAMATISRLPTSAVAAEALLLIELREDRDNIAAALDRSDVLIAAEPSGVVGRMIKDILRRGKDDLRQHRENVRNQIQQITGDPDS